MNKRRLLVLFVLVFSLMMLLVGCGNGNNNSNNGDDKGKGPDNSTNTDGFGAEIPVNTDLKGTIEFWGPMVDFFEETVVEFNKYYPNVQVELISQGLDTTTKAQTAIAAGKGGPDIIQIIWQEVNRYNAQEGLVDLLSDPFNFKEKHLGNYNPVDVDRFRSVDGERLLFFPYNREMTVTYYRPDILEEYGYPSDPEELGDYLEDADNWLDMARTLKQDDKWIFEWAHTPIWNYQGDRGFWDSDLNYIRNTEKFVQYFDLAKQVQQEDLNSGLMVMWTQEADEAMNSGKLVMIQTDGGMAEQVFRNTVKDSAGKWLQTRLPLGDYVGGNGTGYAILEQSKNKEAAYAFLEFALTTQQGLTPLTKNSGHLSVYKPFRESEEYQNRENAWLSNQKAIAHAVSLAPHAPDVFYTSFDGKAKEIWDKGLDDMLANNTDSRAALNQIQTDIEAAVSIDLQELKARLGK